MVERKNNVTIELQKLGAYSFVDRGELGNIVNKFPDVEVKYILSDNAALNDLVLLGIELTPEIKNVIKNADNPIIINDKEY